MRTGPFRLFDDLPPMSVRAERVEARPSCRLRPSTGSGLTAFYSCLEKSIVVSSNWRWKAAQGALHRMCVKRIPFPRHSREGGERSDGTSIHHLPIKFRLPVMGPRLRGGDECVGLDGKERRWHL